MFMKRLDNETPQNQSIRRQLNFMILYVIAVYIPFIIGVITSPYNVLNTSLSKIAWTYDGLTWITLYGILTIPFLVYEIYFYLKFNKEKKDALVGPLLVGCLILGLGIVFPCRGSNFIIKMHCILSQGGAYLIILAITFIIIRYCKKLKADQKSSRTKIAILYGTIFVAIGTLYLLTGTPAILEVGSTFSFLVILYIVNRASSQEAMENYSQRSVAVCVDNQMLA